MRRLNILTVLRDMGKLREHMLCGNPNTIESGVAIICGGPRAQSFDACIQTACQPLLYRHMV